MKQAIPQNKHMKKTLLVFDIDDTITKSESQHQTAFVEAMQTLGITNIDQNWIGYKHITDSYILKKNFDRNLNSQFDADFIERFEAEMMNHLINLKPVEEIKGAGKMIQDILSNPNYGACFATGSLLKPALRKLEQANVAFDEKLVVGSNALYERESIVQESIAKAKHLYQNNDFEHIIAFGDGMWDLNTAKNLGIHFVGIGHNNFSNFKKNKIKHWIADWQEFSLEKMEIDLGIKL